MNAPDLPTPLENPFSTRRTRPGAIEFVFRPGQDAAMLVERLRHTGWRGAIIGPHGTGKSALLATLMPAIKRAGRCPHLIELHDGQRRLPPLRHDELPPVTLLIVDGYEQLSRLSRWRLAWLCRRRGWGLLVTAHASVGLPELYRTETTPDLAAEIVHQLLADRPSPFTAEELAACFAHHSGNLREVLFDLYDLCEQRRPSVEKTI